MTANLHIIQSLAASVDGSETRVVDDDFALSGDDLHQAGTPAQGLAGRDPFELWFGDEAEAPDGSQEEERQFLDDLDAHDIWVSDGAESSRAASPLEEFDDLWASSQSTLDVCDLLSSCNTAASLICRKGPTTAMCSTATTSSPSLSDTYVRSTMLMTLRRKTSGAASDISSSLVAGWTEYKAYSIHLSFRHVLTDVAP